MFRTKRIHAIFITIATGAATIIVVLLLLHFRAVAVPVTARGGEILSSSQIYNQTLMVGSVPIAVSVAADDASREQGLSDTSSLPSNSGKLFVFQTPGNYGFWMKDMNYGLDFVWIDSNMKIVGITSDIAANTYPKIFYPPSFVQYVLEVNAGFSTAHDLSVGQQLILEK